MSATDTLTKEILIAASRDGHRLFRQNVGLGWVGEVIRKTADTILLRNPRPLHAGLAKGSGDCIGWTRDGLFASIEVKTGGDRVRPDQAAWAVAVNAAGGRAGVARSVEEAIEILEGRANPLLAPTRG